MPDETKAKPQVILAAIDGGARSSSVLAVACRMTAVAEGSTLHLVHVVERPFSDGLLAARAYEAALARGGAYLDDATRIARDATSCRVVAHLPGDDTASAIVQIAADIDADLVVVGTADPTSLQRWLYGSVAAKVMAHAGCPVLVIRPKCHPQGKVVVPTIEPACSECVAAQRSSNDPSARCAAHPHRRPEPRLHYEALQALDGGSGLLHLF